MKLKKMVFYRIYRHQFEIDVYYETVFGPLLLIAKGVFECSLSGVIPISTLNFKSFSSVKFH